MISGTRVLPSAYRTTRNHRIGDDSKAEKRSILAPTETTLRSRRNGRIEGWPTRRIGLVRVRIGQPQTHVRIPGAGAYPGESMALHTLTGRSRSRFAPVGAKLFRLLEIVVKLEASCSPSSRLAGEVWSWVIWPPPLIAVKGGER